MTEVIQLTTPITIGQYPNQTTMSHIRVASICFNFQSSYRASNSSVCSFIVEDADTGQQYNVITRQDTPSLALALSVLSATPTGETKSLARLLLEMAQAEMDPVTNTAVIPPGTITTI